MRISLGFRSLKSAFDCQSALQEIEGGPHFTDSPVVAGHVVESHGLTELIVLAELLGLLEEVQGAVNVLLLKVIYCKDVADFAQLFAALGELFRVGTEVRLLHFEQFFKHADGLDVLAFTLVLLDGVFKLLHLSLHLGINGLLRVTVSIHI